VGRWSRRRDRGGQRDAFVVAGVPIWMSLRATMRRNEDMQ
jgi:hypothetical protein